jgi:hypothetical protein
MAFFHEFVAYGAGIQAAVFLVCESARIIGVYLLAKAYVSIKIRFI